MNNTETEKQWRQRLIAERKIFDAIVEFKTNTGLTITDIDVDYVGENILIATTAKLS